MSKQRFTDKELQLIEDAVVRAESRFAVEIVPMFANESSVYATTRLKASLIGMLISYFILIVLNQSDAISWLPFYLQGAMMMVLVILFLLLVEVAYPIKRWLTGEEQLHKSSYNKARQEFAEHKVYSNPDRMGILLFISFFERKFHIICDNKATEYITQEQWSTLSTNFGKDLKTLTTSSAIVKCIDSCADMLEKAGLSSDNLPPSIISNDLRV